MSQSPYDLSYTQNRELSWLAFNERVLEVAEDPSTPEFDRLKFISIFTSNLDEFFMVRVGSILDLTRLKKQGKDNKTGMTYTEQLDAIYARMPGLYAKRDRIYREVEDLLRQKGIANLKYGELSKTELRQADDYFHHNLEPVVSPLVINTRHPFPNIQNNVLNLVCQLVDQEGEHFVGIVTIPQMIPSMLVFPGSGHYILTEDLLAAKVDLLFEGFKALEKAVICVTRNADINLDEEIDDVDENFRLQMKKALKKRARLAPVRMEIQGKLSKDMVDNIKSRLGLKSNQIYQAEAPLKMAYVYGLEDKVPTSLILPLSYKPYRPVVPSDIDMKAPMMPQIEAKDRLLHFPYHSMDPFLKLLKEASNDPYVISIKITIYRLASISKVAEYLAHAAENGKEVMCLMELRARFDEKNNIDWSERLEEAGCTIIYGFEDYKVHSKACLITRHRKGKISYISQLGTGNYNEKTARAYTDFSLMTANEAIGQDVSDFFKNMLISKLDGSYKHLLVAPYGMRPALIKLIENEIAKAQTGHPARITIKCNSVTERRLIDKMAEASQAGVQIDLLVRGICCILPGIPGKTENVTVRSIVGRYLEHHRVYVFGDPESDYCKVYIASADFMTRNISRRVEIAAPIYDPDVKKAILEALDTMMADNARMTLLQADGTYQYVEPRGTFNAQTALMDAASKDAEIGFAKARSQERDPVRLAYPENLLDGPEIQAQADAQGPIGESMIESNLDAETRIKNETESQSSSAKAEVQESRPPSFFERLLSFLKGE